MTMPIGVFIASLFGAFLGGIVSVLSLVWLGEQWELRNPR